MNKFFLIFIICIELVVGTEIKTEIKTEINNVYRKLFEADKNIELLSDKCESKEINLELVNEFIMTFKPLIKKIIKNTNVKYEEKKNFYKKQKIYQIYLYKFIEIMSDLLNKIDEMGVEKISHIANFEFSKSFFAIFYKTLTVFVTKYNTEFMEKQFSGSIQSRKLFFDEFNEFFTEIEKFSTYLYDIKFGNTYSLLRLFNLNKTNKVLISSVMNRFDILKTILNVKNKTTLKDLNYNFILEQKIQFDFISVIVNNEAEENFEFLSEDELAEKYLLENHSIQVNEKCALTDAIFELIESMFELESKAAESDMIIETIKSLYESEATKFDQIKSKNKSKIKIKSKINDVLNIEKNSYKEVLNNFLSKLSIFYEECFNSSEDSNSTIILVVNTLEACFDTENNFSKKVSEIFENISNSNSLGITQFRKIYDNKEILETVETFLSVTHKNLKLFHYVKNDFEKICENNIEEVHFIVSQYLDGKKKLILSLIDLINNFLNCKNVKVESLIFVSVQANFLKIEDFVKLGKTLDKYFTKYFDQDEYFKNGYRFFGYKICILIKHCYKTNDSSALNDKEKSIYYSIVFDIIRIMSENIIEENYYFLKINNKIPKYFTDIFKLANNFINFHSQCVDKIK